jgi:hypothetical protein
LTSVNACAALAEVLQRSGCDAGRSAVASAQGSGAHLPEGAHTRTSSSN